MPLNLDEDKKLKAFLSPMPPLMGDLTKGTSAQQETPINSPQPPTPTNPSLAPTNSGAAEEDTETMPQDDRIADSHPGNQPDDLANYVKGQESQVDKYGPEQEKAVMDSIIKQRGSLGRGISHAGATLADALMQGVAQQGKGGFAQNLDENQARLDEMRLKAPQVEQGMNAQNMGEKQKLEGMTSSSPLGASQANAYKSIFKQFFPQMPEDQLNKLVTNPEVAEKVFPGIGAIVEKQMMMDIQKQGLDINRQRLAAETKNQELQRAEEEKAKKIQAATETLKGSHIPFIGPSHAEKQAAAKTLSDISTGNTPSHGIPDLGETFNGHKVISVKRLK